MPPSIMGAVIRKITSNTSTTSTKGVMLISARAGPRRFSLPKSRGFPAMPRPLPQTAQTVGGALPSPCPENDPLGGSQKLQAEQIHPRGDHLDSIEEVVVGNHARDSHGQARGRGDERLGDTGSHRPRLAEPVIPIPWKASMIPQTVPKSPMNGVMSPS